MIAVVLLVLVLAFGFSIWILSGAHRDSISELNRGELIRQFVAVVKLIELTPEEYHPFILRASRSNKTNLFFGKSSLVPEKKQTFREQKLTKRLTTYLDEDYRDKIRIEVEYDARKMPWSRKNGESEHRKFTGGFRPDEGDDERNDEHDRFSRKYRKHNAPALEYLNISLQLRDGYWLNFHTVIPKPPPTVPRQTIIFLVLTGVCLLLAILFMMRRITRPMRRLASAANGLGVGENIEPLKEEGPEDIRETMQAFNQMNQRLQRFVSDRTRMLAALSHDLRTPVTTMRLRVEMMEESSDRNNLLATLEEMQQMAEATLAFVRQASDTEPTRNVELNALLDSLCEDLADLGQKAAFTEGQETIVACRLVSLKRALRNLIENAVRYGEEARVSLEQDNGAVKVIIQDSGPGIPEESIEQVFEPFFRMEQSRNRNTGGVGLGMSIARNIIHSHGGEIVLQNTGNGLKVIVTLPQG